MVRMGSLGWTGGANGATSGPRTTGSQRTIPVNTGPPSAKVTGHTPPPAAGRRDPREIPDTEEVTGSNLSRPPLFSLAKAVSAPGGQRSSSAAAALRPQAAPHRTDWPFGAGTTRDHH
jgi:hypothetical protein